MAAKNSIITRLESSERKTEEASFRLNKLIGAADEDVLSLKKENDKLQYRLNILRESVAVEELMDTRFMKNIVQMLRLYFTLATDTAFPELPEFAVQVTQTTNPKFGDYQCNVAPSLSALLKSTGKANLNPREVAAEILKHFPVDVDLVEKLEIAGPGFINVFLAIDFLRDETKGVFLNEIRLAPLTIKKRVIVDLSAPNVAKEMHVGHLRSTIIGDSIARLLTFLGYDVARVNHIGDWGTQFGMLIAHLKDTFPDYLKENYHLPVSDLQSFYKESKKRFDEDDVFKKRAYACVVELQAHKPDIIKAWNMICDVSRKEFSKIYERLEIENLVERGESFYQSRMEAIVKDFDSKNLLVDDQPEGDGALQGIRRILYPTVKNPSGPQLLPLMIVKSDGGFTYDTSDMATIKYRIEEEKRDWLIYVVDAGQGVHFSSIFQCAQDVGIWDPVKVRVDHVGFGVVLGEDKKKFKTRSGDTIRLVDLLDEGLKRAEEKLKEKGREKEMSAAEFEAAQSAVAYSCIKYADLSHNRNHEYVFSFDKMLDDKGNTAVYLLYAYTRIKSIARKAGVSEEDLKEYATKNALKYSHEKELKLMKIILKFPEVIERVTNELVLHTLCELLYEIATSFSEFYDNCYCIEKDKEGNTTIHMDRLVLCEATAKVLKTGFDILGLKCVGKM